MKTFKIMDSINKYLQERFSKKYRNNLIPKNLAKGAWENRIVCVSKNTGSVHILMEYDVYSGKVITWGRHYGFCEDTLENFDLYPRKHSNIN